MIDRCPGIIVIQTALAVTEQYQKIIDKLLKKVTPKTIKGKVCVGTTDSVKLTA